MKQKNIFSIFLLLILLPNFCLPIMAKDTFSIDSPTIGKAMQEAIPITFGYIDNTEYYSKCYFSQMNGILDCYIATSAESTNFNEFGIFHLNSKADVKSAKKILQMYLEKRRSEFENGVIYNIEEYPKFQNASVFSAGNYVCYTILAPNDVKKAASAIKKLIS